MDRTTFESALDAICRDLRGEARKSAFKDSKGFENRVREVASKHLGPKAIDFNPAAQAFPDIAVNGSPYGIEVKFTTNDTWRSVANSVAETHRVEGVKKIYLIFGKMGGARDVRWGDYEKCVMHVRTSHVPRFEVEIGTDRPLFQQLGLTYEKFCSCDIHQKMEYIRKYARGRLSKGERLWWLEDAAGEQHTVPIQARLYTQLSQEEKTRLRAEAYLLCPSIVASGRSRQKYDDAVLFLLTYHGVLCHQARDMFSAGSVANPENDDEGGLYIERALKLIELPMLEAARRMDAALFEEYWGKRVAPGKRISEWLRRADQVAKGWTPSKVLFRK